MWGCWERWKWRERERLVERVRAELAGEKMALEVEVERGRVKMELLRGEWVVEQREREKEELERWRGQWELLWKEMKMEMRERSCTSLPTT
jgi:hypothetical protein